MGNIHVKVSKGLFRRHDFVSRTKSYFFVMYDFSV